jgi:hypothetical protein
MEMTQHDIDITREGTHWLAHCLTCGWTNWQHSPIDALIDGDMHRREMATPKRRMK